MRAFGRNSIWEARLLAGLVAAAALGGVTQARSAQPLILTNTNAAGRSASAYMYSPGVADILKMVNAKVDPEVVKAYVKNSPVAYNPSAAEVIALKDRGVPPEVLTAMLERGGELRAQSQPGGQGQYPPPGYPGTMAPSSAMAPYPPSDYGADYGLYPPDYGYGSGYPFYGGYPYGSWWWASFWPWYSSFGPGFGFGFDRFHHHGDFHNFKNFNNVRFQNNDFNRFSSPRFQNFDFNRFNRAGFTPRVGLTQFGVPSRAFAPGAFAGGSSAVAFLGRNGGTAGTIQPPGGAFAPAMRRGGMAPAMRGGAFAPAVRGGFAFHGGGMGFHGGGGGHGGGGHR